MERPIIKKGLKYGITVLPDAAATLTVDMGPVIQITPTVSRTLTLPVVDPSMKGLTFIISNNGAFVVPLVNAAASAVATVPAVAGTTTMVICTGQPPGALGWIGGL
jgi:hypothetical protein